MTIWDKLEGRQAKAAVSLMQCHDAHPGSWKKQAATFLPPFFVERCSLDRESDGVSPFGRARS